MPSPISFSTNEKIRTDEVLTCGITNIPLTKPAYLFFVSHGDNIKSILSIFNSHGIKYSTLQTLNSKDEVVFHFRSNEQIDSKTIKQIWNNWKSLRPKFESEYRYLFWEIDTKDENTLTFVINIYRELDLPLYLHNTMNGYHFLSVKPIHVDLWKKQIEKLRPTNMDYPPVTLRIKPNKYVGEITEFSKDCVITTAYHSDTAELRKLIQTQQLEKIRQKYYVVWYKFGDVQ